MSFQLFLSHHCFRRWLRLGISQQTENFKWFMAKTGSLNFNLLIVFVVLTVINKYNYFSFAQVFFYLVLCSKVKFDEKFFL